MNLDRDKGAPPLYIQVSDRLRRRILEGEWQPGDALLPEQQLCRDFDIARGTLRQALDLLAQEGLLSREQGRGTFVTIRQAAGLGTRQIGFVVPYVRDTFVSNILLGLEKTAEEEGFAVVFSHVSNDADEQAKAITRCVEQALAGIVLYPVDSIHAGPVTEILARRIPFVVVDRYLQGVVTDYVMADHFGGALQATQHLIGLGHRRIAFVSWKDPAVSIAHRRLGYRQALQEAGIAYDPALTCEIEGYPHVEPGDLCTLLAAEPPITAIFAANDQIALAIYRAARAMDRSIPEDLALVGFDDLDIVRHLDVPLTTVAQPAGELGRTAMALLGRRIRGEAKGTQRAILPTRLIVRQSCGGGER